MLIDQHKRPINYLRLSVTDKCNLRCFYCMPEEGIPFWKKENVLSYEELLRICHLLTSQGVNKVRITGGEPFVRKELIYFLEQLANLPNAPEISMTTNATLIEHHIPKLKALGVHKINVSLDAMDEGRFFEITRRNSFKIVFQNLLSLLKEGFEVKVNCVVMNGRNTEDILLLAELARTYPLNVRFLEEMPFDAQSGKRGDLHWNHIKIKDHLESHFGNLDKLQDPPNSTALNYSLKGFKGTLGIIPSFSRTFCGSCNRIRISANGDFRTCLYGAAALNLREQLRLGLSDELLMENIKAAISKKAVNGFVAENENKQTVKDSMAHLGG